ncbi:MAG TPA: hypothetical protein VFY40_28065 [Blastocatellia bacterium]|nr:hypothetical protein [Blastocatellia bacterium]
MTVSTVDAEFGCEEIVAAAEVWGEWRPFVARPARRIDAATGVLYYLAGQRPGL